MTRGPKRGDRVERLLLAALVVVTVLFAVATVLQVVGFLGT